MPRFSTGNQRRSIRLRGYDYSQPGAYFVTICTRRGTCLFGEMIGDEMNLSQDGLIVRRVWSRLPSFFDGISLDAFVIMPNHVHGIIVLSHPSEDRGAGLAMAEEPSGDVGAGLAPPKTPPNREGAASRAPTLPTVVGAFKSISAVEANRVLAISGRMIWQRGYYEHIIRNDEELDRVRAYIQANPLRWVDDHDHPDP